MAIAFRAEAHSTYGLTANTTTCNKPAGTVNDDIMIAVWFQGYGGIHPLDASPPAGWTQVSSYAAVNQNDLSFYGRCSVWYKRAASEGASYVWNHNGYSMYTQLLIASYSGAIATGSPIDVSSVNGSNAGTTATATGVTTTVNNTMLLYAGNNWNNTGTLTPPSGMTERYDGLVYMASEARASAGATSDRTQTLSTNSPWTAFLVAIKDVAGGGGGGATGIPGGGTMLHMSRWMA